MEKRCEIYLRLSAADLIADRSVLDAVLGESAPSALLITGADIEAAEAQLRALLERPERQNIAILIEEHFSLAQALGADGVHMRADAERLAQARLVLGDTGSIGASCPLSRHEAMVMAEGGADYVAFGELDAPSADETAAMIGWWSELFEAPCVAWLGDDANLDDAQSLMAAGADFVAASFNAQQPAESAAFVSQLKAYASEANRHDTGQ